MTKKYLITSALPYINGIKHLGNLIGSMLPADIYAKYLREKGHEVLFICGTDEHGTPAEIAAAASGEDIRTFCDNMYATQKGIYEKFGIDFDYFGRSSSPANHEITTEIYLALKKNGYVFEKSINQYYSNVDARFLPDRYVEGICPLCGYGQARGDQCDACGALMDPENLIEPYSSISKSRDIELRATKHIFLDLAKMQDKIQVWVDSNKDWPDITKGIAKKWLKEGLSERCITRDLSWGIPVPEEGYDGKVFYVWFDAPNAYISITKDFSESGWKNWWMAGDDVVYTQFMAKDNVPFHAIFWPAVLFASGIPFKQVDYIKAFSWLTYEKGKFSTSKKRGVFTDVALELFPPDYWRYYLIANCPEASDADFSFLHFASVVNKDLADILGNFCNRTLSLVYRYCNGRVDASLLRSDVALESDIRDAINAIDDAMDGLRFRAAAQALRALWVIGNEYITANEPWSVMKSDPERATAVLYNCLHLMRIFAIVSRPFIPFTSQKILDLLNDSGDGALLDFAYFKDGHTVCAPERLFEKIDEERVRELEAEFSGGAGSL